MTRCLEDGLKNWCMFLDVAFFVVCFHLSFDWHIPWSKSPSKEPNYQVRISWLAWDFSVITNEVPGFHSTIYGMLLRRRILALQKIQKLQKSWGKHGGVDLLWVKPSKIWGHLGSRYPKTIENMYGFCTFWGRHFKETFQDVGFSSRTFYHQDVCTISLSVMMTFPGRVIDCFPLLQTQLRKAANWNQKRQQLNLKPWSRGRSRSFFLHCYSEIMISMASKASQLSWKGGWDSGVVKSSCYIQWTFSFTIPFYIGEEVEELHTFSAIWAILKSFGWNFSYQH